MRNPTIYNLTIDGENNSSTLHILRAGKRLFFSRKQRHWILIEASFCGGEQNAAPWNLATCIPRTNGTWRGCQVLYATCTSQRGGGHVLYIPYSKLCKFSIFLSMGVTMFCMSCAKPSNLGSIRLHMMVRMASPRVHNLHLDMQKGWGAGGVRSAPDLQNHRV